MDLENDNVAEKPDLDMMLGKYFWRDILYEIISSMDPWDIDISELATRYSTKVDQMKEMNFRIPANVVIVSAVLLRMKSQFIGYKETSFDLSADEFLDDSETGMDAGFTLDTPQALLGPGGNGGTGGSVDSLLVQPMRVPKRRITALELLAAIQEVLEDRIVKSRLKDRYEEKNLVISLHTDIKQLIEETFARVMDILSLKGTVLFSDLASTREEKVSTFLSLLHLCNSQRVKLRQERIFEEIYIDI